MGAGSVAAGRPGHGGGGRLRGRHGPFRRAVAAAGPGAAHLSRRPLIILDEPSACLDPIGERQIFGLLSQLAKDKIILFTTHRYDTIRRADTILVLVDGQVAEMGAPDVLERKAGAFWSLYFGQASHLQPATR